MDQRRHGCRAGHSIGQPSVQWYLCTFSHCSDKKQQRYPSDGVCIYTGWICKYCLIINASEVDEYQNYTQQQAKVTNAIHDEGFIRSIVIIVIFKPKPDEQI